MGEVMAETAVLLKVEPPVAPVSEAGALISFLERAARDPSVDVDKFERLMAMKERVEAQSAARKFNAAVSAAKGKIPPIFKNKTVDFTSQKGRTNYRHEDFAEIARVVDPVLAKHGLSYRYRSQQFSGKLTVTCVLSHASGHFEETTLEIGEDHTGNKNAIQAVGSSATYLQRYTLKLALGLSASTDDDGKASAAAAIETITAEQATTLQELIESVGGNQKQFLAYFKIEKLAELPITQFDRALSAVKKRVGR
jgi:hypothetical protein